MLFANFNQDFSYVLTVCLGKVTEPQLFLNISGVYLWGRGKGIVSLTVIHLEGYTQWVCATKIERVYFGLIFFSFWEIDDGARGIVEMLFCTSLIVLVGAADQPQSSPRKLQIVNTKVSRFTNICTIRQADLSTELFEWSGNQWSANCYFLLLYWLSNWIESRLLSCWRWRYMSMISLIWDYFMLLRRRRIQMVRQKKTMFLSLTLSTNLAEFIT